MLALARGVPAADASMKRGAWEKRSLTGAELRGKVLGIVGLGRIGQEVAARARAFGMHVIAHDPFISEGVAGTAGVELLTLDDLCARADYISLHVPATPETRHLFNESRFARCRRGVRIVNTARGDLIDERALADAIQSGHVGGAGLDVFENEPPVDHRLTKLPQVVATPHIAASTVEAQELVGRDTALSVRGFLLDGAITNAVNFPALRPDEFATLRPWTRLAERLGSLVAQLVGGRTRSVSATFHGPLIAGRADLLTSVVVAGILKPMLSSAVTIVNARAVAGDRGIEVTESQSARPREFTNLIAVRLQTSEGERSVEGTVFEPDSPRLTSIDAVEVEAPLEGTLIVINNDDRPGVIGDVGTLLGRHGVNIANFALGRGRGGAIGVVKIDDPSDAGVRIDEAIEEIRRLPAVRRAALVRGI
jgi:D-3-phosphoglycerate dehydrogenase